MNEVNELINKVILLIRKLNKGKEYVTFLQDEYLDTIKKIIYGLNGKRKRIVF